MNKIRKPGTRPEKTRIPGTRPISIKQIRNSKKMERMMTDTTSFISEKLKQIEEDYNTSTNLFNVLGQITNVTTQTAQDFVDRANGEEEDSEKISTLHKCILTLLNVVQQADQNVKMASVRYRHEVNLLNSMAEELNVEATEEGEEPEEVEATPVFLQDAVEESEASTEMNEEEAASE